MISSAPEALILDLLEWIGPAGRPYREVMDAWRTSCPGLPVWEDANQRGFVVRKHDPSGTTLVILSPGGISHLREMRRQESG